MATTLQTGIFISEILELNQHNRIMHEPRPARDRSSNVWRPPRRELLKINTDAGFNEQSNIGSAGIIARNWKGEVVFGITKRFPATSPIMAEALALREAAAVAVNFGLFRVILESDCLDLIKACRKDIKIGEIVNIVNDILQFAGELTSCGFTWVAKEGNSVAHILAKLTLQNSLPLNWCWRHPPAVQQQIQMDKNGIILRGLDSGNETHFPLNSEYSTALETG